MTYFPPCFRRPTCPSPTVLRNANCAYCGADLREKDATKEHVIGRRFVPRGKLADSWNLILRACAACNGRKADLEDDLSAITMQPDAWGELAVSDPSLQKESRRKGKSFSRSTKKPVRESRAQIRVEAPFFGGSMAFSAEAPPQPDEQRAFQLAQLQLRGFFYMLTFNPHSRRGGFWPDELPGVNAALRRDWGNVGQRAFADAVLNWETRLIAPQLANGYFAAAIRKHPEADCWAWALEWNQNYRLIGFFGAPEPAMGVVRGFPVPQLQTIAQGPDRFVKIRREVPLEANEDVLFADLSEEEAE